MKPGNQSKAGYHKVILLVGFLTTYVVAIVMAITSGVPIVRAQADETYVAPNGSDSNDCLSASTPCATIGRAIYLAVPGGTVYAAIGTYTDVGEEIARINKDISLSGGWNSTFTSLVGRSTVDGQHARHGIVIWEGDTASIDRFTIQNGWTPRFHNYLGGGINNNGGNLTLTNSQVISNTAGDASYGKGGGIYSRLGTLTIISSTIANNYARSIGGGVYISSGTVVIRDSTIVGNSIGRHGSGGRGGGGIHSEGALTIERSVIDSNHVTGSYPGSAIDSSGFLTITNSTISRNTGSETVIYIENVVNLNNVTISRNDGIGLSTIPVYFSDSVINVRNSLIANNGTSDCYSGPGTTFNSLGYNLIRVSETCSLNPTDMSGVDPGLTHLQGDPLHFVPLPGSPVINAGDPNGCSDGSGTLLTVDQRNVARTERCDIGAIESVLTFDKWATGPFYPGGAVTYTITLSNTTDSQNFATVSITDTLPDDLTYIPGSLSATTGTATTVGNTVSWNGSVDAAEQVTVAFSAEIAPSPELFGESITNTAFIYYLPGQTYTDTASFVTRTQLYTLTKEVQGDFRPGGLVTYTVVLDNVGQGSDLAGVTLTDTLPTVLTYVPGSLTASNGNAIISNGSQITWTGDVLSSGASTVSYAAYISESADQSFTNVVESRWKGLSQTSSARVIITSHSYSPLIAHSYCADSFDDFSSDTSGWLIGNDAYVLAQYVNGEYRVQSKQPYLFLFSSPSCERDNYVVEADMRWNRATGSDLGLLFGLLPDFSQYYFVDINSDFQSYAIFRRDSNGSFSFVAPAAQTDAIRTGTQTNHLKITRNGSQIVLEINGVYIGSWSDGTITGQTRVGVVMAPYSDLPVADARFDNFRVMGMGSGLLSLPDHTSANPVNPGRSLPAEFPWQLPTREITR